MPAHVLVTGAAGLIGSAVLDLLADGGVATTALVLEPADVRAGRTLVGDARDPRLVADAVDGADAVIHLAAIPNPDRDPDEEVFARNSQATFVVLDQAARRGVRTPRSPAAMRSAACRSPASRCACPTCRSTPRFRCRSPTRTPSPSAPTKPPPT